MKKIIIAISVAVVAVCCHAAFDFASAKSYDSLAQSDPTGSTCSPTNNAGNAGAAE